MVTKVIIRKQIITNDVLGAVLDLIHGTGVPHKRLGVLQERLGVLQERLGGGLVSCKRGLVSASEAWCPTREA